MSCDECYIDTVLNRISDLESSVAERLEAIETDAKLFNNSIDLLAQHVDAMENAEQSASDNMEAATETIKAILSDDNQSPSSRWLDLVRLQSYCKSGMSWLMQIDMEGGKKP